MNNYPLPPAFYNRAVRWRDRIMTLALTLADKGVGDPDARAERALAELAAIDGRIRGNRQDSVPVTWGEFELMFAATCRRAAELIDSPSPTKKE